MMNRKEQAERLAAAMNQDPKRPGWWTPGRTRGAEHSQAMLIVAIEGGCGDWAAYSMTENRNPWAKESPMEQFVEIISQDGDKLPQALAEKLFPLWAVSLQWRD